jgi:uncharacterized membrane protein/protein-disulfide isomerase
VAGSRSARAHGNPGLEPGGIDPPVPRLERFEMERNGLWARIVAAVAALVGLTASAALFAPYLVDKGFCGEGGGCDAVAHSAYATLFGIPRPVLGVLAFTALLTFVIWRGATARRFAPLVALPFIVEGFHLLAIQAFVLHRFCPFCVVIDLSSIAAGAALLAEWLRVPRDGDRPWLRPGIAAPAAMIAFVAPVLLAAAQPQKPNLPTQVEPLPRKDGKLVLREFVDLECPYCRMTHVALKKALASRPDIVVERRHVPLPRHESAMPAAIAACCAAEQGAEESFIDKVMTTDVAPDEVFCRKTAGELGLDLARYDECRKSDRPKQRIDADTALYKSTKVPGLPTLELDGERHIGALDAQGAVAFVSKHR